MASYTTMKSVDASSEEIQEMMVTKAHELFSVCDTEKKGFITKRDMQRLQTELPLSPDQLEDVFDSLDDDGNGYLTLEEFTEGFGSFLGFGSAIKKQSSLNSQSSGEQVFENEHVEPDPDSEHFEEMVSHIGAQGIFEDVDTIKSLWGRLKNDEPELLGNFEQFLVKVTTEIKRSHQDFQTLESALRNKNTSHDEEVQKLYEEMELQIKLEKERLTTDEKARERQLRDEMERELREKDEQLQEMLRKHQEMETKLHELNAQETETKQENEKLATYKNELENMLSYSERHLEDSRSYVNDLKHKQRAEKRDRAMAALQISEGIALERESLVKQLDMLREMNRKLKDERDEAESRRAPGGLQAELDAVNGEHMFGHDATDLEAVDSPPLARSVSQADSTSPRNTARKPLSKQGSILSDYFSNPDQSRHGLGAKPSIEEDEDIEIEDDIIPSTYQSNLQCQADSIDGNLTLQDGRRSHMEMYDSSSPRREPVGAQDIVTPVVEREDLTGRAPERVFKVVFVGDSGVGKSSFIHRFCNNVFKGTFSATIGVDFQIRNLRVDNHIIALQLWDTAGQERFRSITKQYFRKADGVLVMYDVTSELSYKNVRNWMLSVQDGVEDGTVLTLLGNKMDLVEGEDVRPVTTKDGVRLADEYGALFFEGSAKSGMNVPEALQAMATLLVEREDKQLENALNLTDDSKKKGCCG